MRITKFGHCCLLIEEGGIRILTDPGAYSTQQNDVKDVDIVLITHEHNDHIHIESLKTLLANNPQAKVMTNHRVGAVLEKEGIPFTLLEHGQQTIEHGVTIRGFGTEHALMHPDLPVVPNTGYFIADRLFYPGDAFTNPGKPIDVLALPMAGPWTKLMDAVEYAKMLKPKTCFPVHDGGLKAPGSVHAHPPKLLEPHGIHFVALKPGESLEVE